MSKLKTGSSSELTPFYGVSSYNCNNRKLFNFESEGYFNG